MTKNDTSNPNYLTTDDLAVRWKCSREFATAFMHRRGSGAIKIGRRLLVTEKEVVQHEATKGVITG
jgi:hypothetical protein